MQFVYPFFLCVVKFLLQAIEDTLVHLGLPDGLRANSGGESSLVAQVVETIGELIGVELSTVIEDDGTGDAEVGDDVPPNEPSYFSGGYGGDSLGLYPFDKVVDHNKKILTLPRSFEERAEDIHTLCGER